MKRSRSGTAPPTDGPRLPTILLIVALAVVLAFAGSLVFGLRGSHEPDVAEPEAKVEKPQSAVVHDARAKVEVLNGSGKTGLAKLATTKLRDAGFDVVQFGNAAKTSATSYVIDRIGRKEVATAVGKSIAIGSVQTQVDTSRYVDATVVLGKDWPPEEQQAQTKKSLKDRLLRR